MNNIETTKSEVLGKQKSLFLENLENFLEHHPEYRGPLFKSSRVIDIGCKSELEVTDQGWTLIETGKVLATTNRNDLPPLPSFKTPARILLVEGFGLGEQIRQIIESKHLFDNLVVVEPSIERFLIAMHSKLFADLFCNEKIYWIVGKNPDECFVDFLQFLRVPIRAFQMSASEVIPNPRYREVDPSLFVTVWDEWTAACEQISHHFGSKEDSLRGFANTMANLDFVEQNPGIGALRDAFRGYPAIVVSTGPSLSRSIEQLKMIQDRALIICADSSLSILLKNGITPHFTASIERDMHTVKYFKAASNYGAVKTRLIAYPILQPEALQTYPGQKVVAYRDYGYFHYLEEQVSRGILSSSSSVAHFCCRIAAFLGCPHIYLVGQDLAYDPELLSSHASDVAFEEWTKPTTKEELEAKLAKEGEQLLFVPGNIAEVVPTRTYYFIYMKEFSWEAGQLPVSVVNCTDGGAKIPNIPWKPLHEVVRGLIPLQDPFHVIDSKLKYGPPKSFDWTVIREYLTSLNEKLTEILGHCEAFAAEKSIPQEAAALIVITLRRAQNDLLTDTRFVCFIVQNAGVEFLKIENQWALVSEVNNRNFAEILNVLESWYKLVFEVSGRILKALPTRSAV